MRYLDRQVDHMTTTWPMPVTVYGTEVCLDLPVMFEFLVERLEPDRDAGISQTYYEANLEKVWIVGAILEDEDGEEYWDAKALTEIDVEKLPEVVVANLCETYEGRTDPRQMDWTCA